MYGHGYSSYCGCGGHGCKKCCIPRCYKPSCPPKVSGNWSLTLKNLVGPATSCPPNNVTESQPIMLALFQCSSPDDAFVIANVTSGPTGLSPIRIGDQLPGIFHKDSRECWTLKLASPRDNTTFEMNFLGGQCPKRANYSYTKPFDLSSGDFAAVGGGCATKS